MLFLLPPRDRDIKVDVFTVTVCVPFLVSGEAGVVSRISVEVYCNRLSQVSLFTFSIQYEVSVTLLVPEDFCHLLIRGISCFF